MPDRAPQERGLLKGLERCLRGAGAAAAARERPAGAASSRGAASAATFTLFAHVNSVLKESKLHMHMCVYENKFVGW